MQQPDLTTRLARLKFRAWHRGTREADYMVGGFFDRYHADWGEAEVAWFEALVDEEDVDILSWAFGTAPTPQRYHGPLLDAFQRIDYVNI